MTDRPIIFSSSMVLALLREITNPGTGKTMTRRLAWGDLKKGALVKIGCRPTPWQQVQPGDKLWVRENFWRFGRWVPKMKNGKMSYEFQPIPWAAQHAIGPIDHLPQGLMFAADLCPTLPFISGKFGSSNLAWHLRPNIFLERRHSRLTLTVTKTKIERLQSISEEDAKAEGGMYHDGHGVGASGWRHDINDGIVFGDCRKSFNRLWTRLHGTNSWDENPEVVAMTFDVNLRNIEKMK